MKNFILPFFLLATFSGYAQLSRPVLEDATTVFDCLNKDYRQNNDDLTAFSEAGKDLDKIMEIMRYYMISQPNSCTAPALPSTNSYLVDQSIIDNYTGVSNKYFKLGTSLEICLFDVNTIVDKEKMATGGITYEHSKVYDIDPKKGPNYQLEVPIKIDDAIKKIKAELVSIDFAIERIKPTINQNKATYSLNSEVVLALEKNKDILSKTMNAFIYHRNYKIMEHLESAINCTPYNSINAELEKNYKIISNSIEIKKNPDIANFINTYTNLTPAAVNGTPVSCNINNETVIIKRISIALIDSQASVLVNNKALPTNYLNNIVAHLTTFKNILEEKNKALTCSNCQLKEVLVILKNHYNTQNLRPDQIFATTSYNQKSFTALAGDALFSVILEGLTEVIKERMNTELANALVQNLVYVNNKGADSSYVYMLNAMMPTTMDLLQKDPGSLLSNPSIISSFIKNDIAELINNLMNLRNDEKFDEFLEAIKLDSTQRIITIDALNTFYLINKSATINEYLWETSKFKIWNQKNFKKYKIKNQISGLSLIADALMVRSGSNNFTFTSYDYFINYYSSEKFRKIYYYFLDVQNIKYYNSSPLITTIIHNPDKSDYLLGVLESFNKVNNLHNQVLIAKKAGDKEKLQIYIGDYATSLVDLIHHSIKEHPDLRDASLRDFDIYASSAKDAISIYRDITQKRYITAINTALKIPLKHLEKYNTITNEQFSKMPQLEKDTVLAVRKYQAFLEYVNKPLAFVFDMSQVQTKDDAKKVIKEYSLGTGSYKDNRTNYFTANIQANPGYVYGAPLLKGNRTKAFGIVAPVGISLNWGMRYKGIKRPIKNRNDFFCFSTFIGIIDLAAPLMLVEKGDTVSFKQLTAKNIISPAFYLMLGIPRTPLSLTTGIQYTPDLSIINQSGGTLRCNIGLTVDLPLFRFKAIPFKKL